MECRVEILFRYASELLRLLDEEDLIRAIEDLEFRNREVCLIHFLRSLGIERPTFLD
jgi:hypothetical protein